MTLFNSVGDSSQAVRTCNGPNRLCAILFLLFLGTSAEGRVHSYKSGQGDGSLSPSSKAIAAKEPKHYKNYCLSLLKSFCSRLQQTWYEGDNDLYLSGYAWHNRYTYSREKIKHYNEAAWGGGLGKGLFDEQGNWHGLYAIGFLDSHSHVEPAAGYAYLKIASLNKDWKAGLGYTVLVTSRVDINHNIPFAGILPWASVFFKKTSIAATYIPGFHHNGNVLYLLGKYTF